MENTYFMSENEEGGVDFLEMKKRKDSYTIKEMPDDLRSEFKSACALQDINMRGAILWFMKQVVAGKIRPK